MAWKYDPALSTTRDKVRLLIGDVIEEQPLLSNAEIDFVLNERGDEPYSAGAELCRTLASRFGRQADVVDGAIRIKRAEQSKQFLDLADELERRANRSAIPIATNDTTKSDFFRKELHLPEEDSS